eukprot:TRINITY_DN8789_c0_g1_i1.p1 TRINITY_DN8789_c0_g1~~TRINITY_DN8789_c0_g1_i1.p1  ORF type:complete len:265 (-),score=50.93 TRINITY_DN8789_c0_g1_i1:21-791(-)
MGVKSNLLIRSIEAKFSMIRRIQFLLGRPLQRSLLRTIPLRNISNQPPQPNFREMFIENLSKVPLQVTTPSSWFRFRTSLSTYVANSFMIPFIEKNVPSFRAEQFLEGAKSVFPVIRKMVEEERLEELEPLLGKMFFLRIQSLSNFRNFFANGIRIQHTHRDLTAQIIDLGPTLPLQLTVSVLFKYKGSMKYLDKETGECVLSEGHPHFNVESDFESVWQFRSPLDAERKIVGWKVHSISVVGVKPIQKSENTESE